MRKRAFPGGVTTTMGMTRRSILRGAGFGLGWVALAWPSAQALAASGDSFGNQAEWRQSYDAGGNIAMRRSSTPMLSAESVSATEQAIQQYRQIAAQGGWRPLAPSERLRLGARGASVQALRQRLAITGDIDPSAGNSNIYDSYVESAVRRFQERHGLHATGTVNQGTLNALNVPVSTRIHQLETNIVRLRSYSGNLGGRYVVANIPAALVETVENGVVATRHAAGVGKIDRQSPILQTKIPEINFNPTWTVPASIIRKDLIPKMQKEPTYLTENKIRIIGPAGEIAPERVNWHSDEATKYTFRQDPGGEFNSLGFVRINIPSPHGVYMHDTPAKGIFGDDFRFVSSGCIRVQNVRDYITWLLKDTPGWDRGRIDEALRTGQRLDARLTSPVPVYWVYVTAWATPDGLVQFRDDIYRKDGGTAGGPVAQLPQSQAEPVEE